jgi:hypothetical protein
MGPFQARQMQESACNCDCVGKLLLKGDLDSVILQVKVALLFRSTYN